MRHIVAISKEEWLADLEKQRTEQKQRQAIDKLERKGFVDNNAALNRNTIMDSAVWHTEGNGNPIRNSSGRIMAAYGVARQNKEHPNTVHYHEPESRQNQGSETSDEAQVPYFERFRSLGGCGAPRRQQTDSPQPILAQAPLAAEESFASTRKTKPIITSYIEHADLNEVRYKEAMRNEWKKALDKQIEEKKNRQLLEKQRLEQESKKWDMPKPVDNPAYHDEKRPLSNASAFIEQNIAEPVPVTTLNENVAKRHVNATHIDRNSIPGLKPESPPTNAEESNQPRSSLPIRSPVKPQNEPTKGKSELCSRSIQTSAPAVALKKGPAPLKKQNPVKKPSVRLLTRGTQTNSASLTSISETRKADQKKPALSKPPVKEKTQLKSVPKKAVAAESHRATVAKTEPAKSSPALPKSKLLPDSPKSKVDVGPVQLLALEELELFSKYLQSKQREPSFQFG